MTTFFAFYIDKTIKSSITTYIIYTKYIGGDNMAIDENKNTQILLTLSFELLQKIEDYQFNNRISNRSEAVRELIKKGLEK